MFKGMKRGRRDKEWDIFEIIPKVKIAGLARNDVGILKQVQDDGIPGQARDDEMPDQVRHDEGDIVGRFSIDLEERLKCNMGRAKEDACMLEKIINNKP